MNSLVKQPTAASIILMCLYGLSGCVESKHPLSDPEKADIHAEIVGIWIWEGSGVKGDEWTIAAAGKGFPRGILRITAQQDGKTETLFAFSTKLDGHHYLNAVNFKGEVLPKKWDKQLVKSYTLMPYSISKDTFTGTLFNSKYISNAIHAKQVAGKFPATVLDADLLDTDLATGAAPYVKTQEAIDEMHLTASTPKLRDFFSKQRGQLFRNDSQKGKRKVESKSEVAK